MLFIYKLPSVVVLQSPAFFRRQKYKIRKINIDITRTPIIPMTTAVVQVFPELSEVVVIFAVATLKISVVILFFPRKLSGIYIYLLYSVVFSH